MFRLHLLLCLAATAAGHDEAALRKLAHEHMLLLERWIDMADGSDEVLKTFAPNVKYCFGGQCGKPAEVMKPWRKVVSTIKRFGWTPLNFADNYAYFLWDHELSAGSCTARYYGHIHLYVDDKLKITEVHGSPTEPAQFVQDLTRALSDECKKEGQAIVKTRKAFHKHLENFFNYMTKGKGSTAVFDDFTPDAQFCFSGVCTTPREAFRDWREIVDSYDEGFVEETLEENLGVVQWNHVLTVGKCSFPISGRYLVYFNNERKITGAHDWPLDVAYFKTSSAKFLSDECQKGASKNDEL